MTDDGVLITKRASRFWDGEIMLIERSHPLVNGVRVCGFACILRHELASLDRVRMNCCLGACRNCVESAVGGWPSSILTERVSAGCAGEQITVLLHVRR